MRKEVQKKLQSVDTTWLRKWGWHRWFAWYPVIVKRSVQADLWVWLEWVERRQAADWDETPARFFWQYRLPDGSNSYYS